MQFYLSLYFFVKMKINQTICTIYTYKYINKWEVTMKFKRIKDLREDHDKYQKDIAELLGISQQYYS